MNYSFFFSIHYYNHFSPYTLGSFNWHNLHFAPLCIGLEAVTGLEVGTGVSGALALISNCQITLAWVISRPDAGRHRRRRRPLTTSGCSCIAGFWWAELLSAPQAQILKWCPLHVGRCPSVSQSVSKSGTQSVNRSLIHAIIYIRGSSQASPAENPAKLQCARL